MTLFCTLRTAVLENHDSGKGGQFEMRIEIDESTIDHASDPRGYVNREIATHLAQAIVDTGAPRELWYVEFEPIAQREFNFPPAMRF